MNTTIKHCYLHAPIHQVREAWEQWPHEPHEVYFIPAQGGCFLVERCETPHAFSLPSLLPAERQRATELERFAAEFEKAG
jgi:hypothetical protein